MTETLALTARGNPLSYRLSPNPSNHAQAAAFGCAGLRGELPSLKPVGLRRSQCLSKSSTRTSDHQDLFSGPEVFGSLQCHSLFWTEVVFLRAPTDAEVPSVELLKALGPSWFATVSHG